MRRSLKIPRKKGTKSISLYFFNFPFTDLFNNLCFCAPQCYLTLSPGASQQFSFPLYSSFSKVFTFSSYVLNPRRFSFCFFYSLLCVVIWNKLGVLTVLRGLSTDLDFSSRSFFDYIVLFCFLYAWLGCFRILDFDLAFGLMEKYFCRISDS